MGKASNPQPPNAQDVARRLIILRTVVAHAYIMPPRDFIEPMLAKMDHSEANEFKAEIEKASQDYWNNLRALGLWPYMSPSEMAFAETTAFTITDRQRVDATWRMESSMILMWALKLIPDVLTYEKESDSKVLGQVIPGDTRQFLASAELRSSEEILAARDLAEFWHWRSRTRELIESGRPLEVTAQMRSAGIRSYDDIVRQAARAGFEKGGIPRPIDEDFPVNGKAYRDLSRVEWWNVQSISTERHRSLNWLCGYAEGNEWDATPTDT